MPCKSVIHGLDLERRPFAEAGHVVVKREPPVVNVDERRIVDLQDEAGIDDRLVFLADRLGQAPTYSPPGFCNSSFGRICSVAGDTAVMKASSTRVPRARGLRFSMSRLIAAWPTYLTGPVQARPYMRRAAGAALRAARLMPPRRHRTRQIPCVPCCRRSKLRGPSWPALAQLEARNAVIDVGPPGAEIGRAPHSLAKFAIIDDVDAGLICWRTTSAIADCKRGCSLFGRIVPIKLDQVVGPRQAADVGREYPIDASLHVSSSLWPVRPKSAAIFCAIGSLMPAVYGTGRRAQTMTRYTACLRRCRQR